MDKNHFANKYSSFTNLQLYTILQNKGDYQEVALQAAQEEFDKRQLSEYTATCSSISTGKQLPPFIM